MMRDGAVALQANQGRRWSYQPVGIAAAKCDTIPRMRLFLLPAALFLASCGVEKDRTQPKSEVSTATQAEPEATVATTVAFTEGPAQGPDGLIYFTDGTNNRILRFDPRTKKHEVFRADSNRSNGLLFDSEGRLIACESSDAERSNPRL